MNNHIEQIIKSIANKLTTVYESSEQRIEIAWRIISIITQKNRAQLLAHDVSILTQEQQTIVDHWLDAMINKHMPLDYLIGQVPFGDLRLFVEPPCLIPRIETEEWCLNLIDQLKPIHNEALTILDLCTGSGCIALALAHALPKSLVYGIDNAPHAITLAQKNARANHINNVVFLYSDLFKQLPQNIQFDLITANPPYIAQDELPSLEKSVTEWEDHHALIAPENGLGVIKQIIDQAAQWLKATTIVKLYTPQLIIEIGYQQGEAVRTYMYEKNFIDIHVIKDLAGNDRCVSGRIK